MIFVQHLKFYRVVDTHGYWLPLAIAEIQTNGHGHANSPGAPLISLCEGWANHWMNDFTSFRPQGIAREGLKTIKSTNNQLFIHYT